MSLIKGALAASLLGLLVGTAGCADETARPIAGHAVRDASELEDAAPAADGGSRLERARAALDAGIAAHEGAAEAAPAEHSAKPNAASKHNTAVPASAAAAASGDDDDAGVPRAPGMLPPEQAAGALAIASLGERLFQDRTLSLTSTQSCASCHVADSAFTGSADHDDPYFPVSKGATGQVFGTRNAPTAMYTDLIPPFAFVRVNAEVDPNAYAPVGGLFWDGRASSLSEQAAAPFVNAREMALPDKQAVVERVRKAAYARMFVQLFGADALSNVELAYQHVTDAIAAFERSERFHPFSSKFDGYLRGQAQLSEQEQRGFELFQDPAKANCIACHAGKPDSHEPRDWVLSNFSYGNLGVPRNMKIADNAAPSYFDLGLCQSAAVTAQIPAEIADKAALLASLCGAFRVPTLRNVAKTAPYMHNGFFATLRDAVDFHVTRDTDPARWYPSAADGSVRKLDDLPEQYWSNLTQQLPFDRKLGEEPRLSAEEIDAVVQFLSTLSDGYTP